MTCKHEPTDAVAAFVHVCRHCGLPIEAVTCGRCQGTGEGKVWHAMERADKCRHCNGTGVARWEEAK